ncbi:hypothetical protein AR457_00260 [Streptomyces agglomeratus]|uniref:Uncharacterized protein n=2 Tax=Streptomyces agglomeratus TaxID=285458 RepID=A0A1E5P0X8_9ACTN|nr:hypothetical protein AS594_00290 [Streptomyces agglomeratus]OEJ42788.1 hypothetical protein AR457_00260 [Streptomyces agglomeratus]OEJ55293.1 hypothetical protein BGK72_35570 [Streptomyces agglomeratus]OEJ62642.1 hypothetical protein BGM19_36390 [Streptomyces agglomeratus]
MMTLLRESAQLRKILDLREYESADGDRPYDQALHAAARRMLDPVDKITVRMATEAANRGAFHWTLTLTQRLRRGLAGQRPCTLGTDPAQGGSLGHAAAWWRALHAGRPLRAAQLIGWTA